MSRPVADLAGIHGVPEAALTPEVLSALPPTSPPAPWALRLDAILWIHQATDEALDLVAPALRGGRHLPLTVGGFVRYHETPVGPYSEVFGSPVVLVRRGLTMGTVPFMVVDSLASIRGGRENWALPKSLGAFAWEGDDAVRAHGESPAGAWSVSARARPVGPPLPTWAPAWNRQATPDGRVLRIAARARGLAKMATVHVDSSGPSLPSWLVPGEHVGIVLRRGRMTFGAPRVVG